MAMHWIAEDWPVHKAVRHAIDAVAYFGHVATDESEPVEGSQDLLSDRSEGADGNRLFARNTARMKAAIAKWERREDRGEFDGPPRPETVLDGKDTVVEQIAATIRRRQRKATTRA